MKKLTLGITAVVFLLCPVSVCRARNADRIKPYRENPKYWQYKGEPVLLLGGSKTDHIFLAEGLKEHLDEMVGVGANYVRNTMSQREGLDLKPHRRLADGKFDLDQWNPVYWRKFADCLKWCEERDIEPRMGLLSDRESDQAYLSARSGEKYVLYFTEGGSVGLDLTGHRGRFQLRWISIRTGDWADKTVVSGDKVVTINAPGKAAWVATMVRQ